LKNAMPTLNDTPNVRAGRFGGRSPNRQYSPCRTTAKILVWGERRYSGLVIDNGEARAGPPSSGRPDIDLDFETGAGRQGQQDFERELVDLPTQQVI